MKKSFKVMLALTTVLTASPVLITTGLISASASANYYNTNISVQGKSVSSPKHIDADDAGNLTAFLPLYYVNQALSQYGITGSWDGNVWTITTPQSMKVDLSNLPTSEQTNSSVLAMSINGTTVQYAPRQAAGDPTNGYQSTTYLPIWYIDQVLNRLSINASWDGVNWNLSLNAVQANLVKEVNVSGTNMVEASDGTMYIETLQGNVVKLDANGGIEGNAQTKFDSNTGLVLSHDGQTLYADGTVVQNTSYNNDLANVGDQVTINTTDMSISNTFGTPFASLSPDGKTGYSIETGQLLTNSGSYNSSSLLTSSDNPNGCYDMDTSPDGSTLYIDPNAEVLSFNLVEFNTLSDSFQTENVVGGYDGMTLSPDGSTLYLAKWDSNPEILTFSTASNNVIGSPITGTYLPKNDPSDGDALTISGSVLFGVGNINGQKAVCVVDTSQNKVEGAVMNKNFGNIKAITASNKGSTLDVLTDNGLYIYSIQTE